MSPAIRFLFGLAATVCAQVYLSSSAHADEKLPNILWITAEDMSPTLGCWDDGYALTPNIDALAHESVKYSHLFATAPVCSPARSCIITGCYATTLGTQRLRSQFPIPDQMQGFPSLLRKLGYFCTNNVKTDYNTSNQRDIIHASWDQCSATAHWRSSRGGAAVLCRVQSYDLAPVSDDGHAFRTISKRCSEPSPGTDGP